MKALNLSLPKNFWPYFVFYCLFNFSFGFLSELSSVAVSNTYLGHISLSVLDVFVKIGISILGVVFLVFSRFFTTYEILRGLLFIYVLAFTFFVFLAFPFYNQVELPAFFAFFVKLYVKLPPGEELPSFVGIWVFNLFYFFIFLSYSLISVCFWGLALEYFNLKQARKTVPFLSIIPILFFFPLAKELFAFEKVAALFAGGPQFSFVSFFGFSLLFNWVLSFILFALPLLFSAKNSSEVDPPKKANKKILSLSGFIFWLALLLVTFDLLYSGVSFTWTELLKIEYTNVLERELFFNNFNLLLRYQGIVIALFFPFGLYFLFQFFSWKVLGYTKIFIMGIMALLFYQGFFWASDFDSPAEFASFLLRGTWFQHAKFLLLAFFWVPLRELSFYALNQNNRFQGRLCLDLIFLPFLIELVRSGWEWLLSFAGSDNFTILLMLLCQAIFAFLISLLVIRKLSAYIDPKLS